LLDFIAHMSIKNLSGEVTEIVTLAIIIAKIIAAKFLLY